MMAEMDHFVHHANVNSVKVQEFVTVKGQS